MSQHSAAYRAYLQSPQWRAKRRALFAATGQCCQRCGQSVWEDGIRLEAHHLTYDRLGDEAMGDLLALCPPCHRLADGERAAETAERIAEARLDGWATKVYGENWDLYYELETVEDHFDRWLESREEDEW